MTHRNNLTDLVQRLRTLLALTHGTDSGYIFIGGRLCANTRSLVTDTVCIEMDLDTDHLDITKLENGNPVLCFADGKVYRYNGEFADVRDHVWSLVESPPLWKTAPPVA